MPVEISRECENTGIKKRAQSNSLLCIGSALAKPFEVVLLFIIGLCGRVDAGRQARFF